MELLKSAYQKLAVADHLLSTTYSMVKEPKLLISVVDNILSALEAAITAVLEHERKSMHFEYENTFDSKMEMFRRKILSRHDLKPEILNFTNEMKGIIDEHKKASVEFKKKDKYVISDNDYNMTLLSAEDLRKKLKITRKYLDEISHFLGAK